MRIGLSLFALFASAFFLIAADQPTPAANHTAVGTIVKIEPAEREIYIMSDGTKLEYYFNAKTTVAHDGAEKRYEDLKQGQQVKVSSRKIGKRLDPLSVEILD